ncbi:MULTISPECIES: type I restriction-modification enzyme R subunit C-terminal domain-containing protein [unclassified Thiocapsa]|uniref:type I restriction-modification enzyme R subunit C-terminal domain-containing protein n=1 Tax=unclassified Thiocapsa TaxID=2641286 RepID=UPI0035B4C450
MSLDNFIVRPKRRFVEKYQDKAAWQQLSAEVQTEDYWQDITLPMLEHLRRRLRSLVKLIEPGERKTVYSDFEDEGIAGPEDLERIRNEGGIGLLIRSLVGLDREAAKQALAGFIDGRELTANQIEFINLIIDHLTERGLLDPRRIYESPFTDFDDQGVTGVFSLEDAKLLVQVLKLVEARAAA